MQLQRMTWPQVERYFSERDTVIVGVGSCENHGTHLPLGTDALVPEKLEEMIGERTQVLCTPVLPFGSCDYFTGYPGTVSLGNELLYQVLEKVTDGLYRAGARHFVFLNGHGGNTSSIERVCYALSKHGALGAVLNWWSLAGLLNRDWAGGHGGGEETAAILYVDPSLVDRGAMQPCDIEDLTAEIRSCSLKAVEFRGVKIPVPRDVRPICRNGWLGPDRIEDATREWGEEMLTAVADYAAAFVEAFEKAPLR